MYICMLGVSTLERFRQCGIFSFVNIQYTMCTCLLCCIICIVKFDICKFKLTIHSSSKNSNLHSFIMFGKGTLQKIPVKRFWQVEASRGKKGKCLNWILTNTKAPRDA